MFVDRTRIHVSGGAGGNGCCSFRREKYVSHGGPNGGDGGAGGDVVLVADSRVHSLYHLRHRPHTKGKPGVHGKGKDQHGRVGEDAHILVPCGTLVRAFDGEEVVADLTQDGQRYLAASGGRGGKGNARFKTATDKAPRFAELGEPGQSAEYILELKLIAEVGLVGLPNAGKSTFLASVTAANPKVAAYPFTTLSPNLGVAPLSGFRTITIADIPGIIEGAAEGKGLGHDFLRHIERTKVLMFLIDLGDEAPVDTLEALEAELAEYSPVFATRPRVVVLNKADIPENAAKFESLRAELDSPFLVSGLTGQDVDALMEHLWTIVERVRKEEAEEGDEEDERVEYTFKAPYVIEREGSDYRVEGSNVIRAVLMTDFSNEEAVRYLHRRFVKMGLLKALKQMGAVEGATIHIGDMELEYHDE